MDFRWNVIDVCYIYKQIKYDNNIWIGKFNKNICCPIQCRLDYIQQ